MRATNLVGRVRGSSLGLGGAVGLLGRHLDFRGWLVRICCVGVLISLVD